MNITLKELEIWFVTGSQHLYGEETLRLVRKHSDEIAKFLSGKLPVAVSVKPVLTTPEAILALCREANTATKCIGIVAWMHTFSPAKMWIAGLSELRAPVLHLHTQYNRDLPWKTIDMDFMNLNQSAHGDREYGYIMTRMRLNRKVVVGYWQDSEVIARVAVWARAAAGWHDMRNAKVARFGDNMREVAVTEGDKVEAQKKFGYSVNGFGVGDLVAEIERVRDAEIDECIGRYLADYTVAGSVKKEGTRNESMRVAAKIECGMRNFLDRGGFSAFTTTFEDLHGLGQLPGLAVQRLMKDGFGFGAEGDWKTAVLVRAMKTMAQGLPGGTSFMEDYTYHFDPAGMRVLGAHMLEVCPSIAASTPSLEIHPLGIGGKDDPVRLVFDTGTGPAINVSMIDMGNRFRLIVNDVNVCPAPEAMPELPVARVVWEAFPDLPTAAAAWIYAGGAHHTSFSMALDAGYIDDFAEMADVEYVHIGKETSIGEFRKELRWNEVYYLLRKSL